MWAGTRSTYGLLLSETSKRVCFEVRVTECLQAAHVPAEEKEQNTLHGIRLGWSAGRSGEAVRATALGEVKNSWAFCSDGKKAGCGRFRKYGKPFIEQESDLPVVVLASLEIRTLEDGEELSEEEEETVKKLEQGKVIDAGNMEAKEEDDEEAEEGEATSETKSDTPVPVAPSGPRRAVCLSFAINGESQGEAFRLPLETLLRKSAEVISTEEGEEEKRQLVFFPHVYAKNVKFEVNFGGQEAKLWSFRSQKAAAEAPVETESGDTKAVEVEENMETGEIEEKAMKTGANL